MDAIIRNAKEQIEAAQRNTSQNSQILHNYSLTRHHYLEDIFNYELNFVNECCDFCGIVNHQLSQNYAKITSKLEKFSELSPKLVNESKINFTEDINTKNENSVEEDYENENSVKKEVNVFTEDINDIRKSSIDTAELQVMMNILPKYQNTVNSEHMNRENDKIERESNLLKTQKIRALDFLYEMQEFCAGFMDLDEKFTENKK